MLIDFTFAALIILAIFKGYQKGLILAIFSIIAFIVGLAAALKLSTVVAAYLKESVNVSAKWLPFIAFALVFFVVVLLVRLGGKLVEKTFQAVMLGWANRIGGIVLYAALYLIILSIFIFYAQKLQLLQPATIQASSTYKFIQPWGPVIMDNIGKVIPIFKDMFAQLGDFFNLVTNKIQH
jgi:membrane protein required for colicin V production